MTQVTQDTRNWVADGLVFSAESQVSDIKDASLTTDGLILFLEELLTMRDGVWQHTVDVTAVRSDHPTYDGPDGHSGGNAIDFVSTVFAPEHLIADIQKCQMAKGIGLGGAYQMYANELGGYNEQSKLFQDNDETHIHVQVVGY